MNNGKFSLEHNVNFTLHTFFISDCYFLTCVYYYINVVKFTCFM